MRCVLRGLLVGAALALAGCGGGGGGGGATSLTGATVPEGANAAPASATVFITVDTDFGGDQWQRARDLLDRFPSGGNLLAQARERLASQDIEFQRDVKPALGPETDIVLLGPLNHPTSAVYLTQPRDPDALKRLIAKDRDENYVTRKIGDWTAIAETRGQLDRFVAARNDGALIDNEDFLDAMKAFSPDTAARVYVRGADIQRAFDAGLSGRGAPTGFSERLGRLRSLTAGAGAADDGVLVQASFPASNADRLNTYSPSLADDLPAGARLYFSFGDVEGALRRGLREVGSAFPRFAQQRAQIEGALGSLDTNILPLFGKEGALAVYSGGSQPRIVFALAVDDERNARGVLQRIRALAQLSGRATAAPFSTDGVNGTRFAVGRASLYAAVFDGKLVLTNDESLISDVHSSGDKLADDSQYKEARDAASVPDEVLGLLYVNTKTGLPLAYRLAQRAGLDISPSASANTKPLRALLLYAAAQHDRVTISGFQVIK